MNVSDRREPIDVSPVLKQLGVLKKDAKDEVPRDKSTGEAFLTAMSESNNVKTCVDFIFPGGIPVDQTFLDQLDEFHRWIGISESGDEALGIVWSEAIGRLTDSQRLELLNAFAAQESHAFFDNSRSLWVVVRDHEFAPDFLADWFVPLLKAVERDMMQEDVWKTIRIVCECHPHAAGRVLGQYLVTPDARRNSVAGFMLGLLRVQELDSDTAKEIKGIDEAYKNHADSTGRAVFNWSWVTTARQRELTERELTEFLDRSKQSEDDLNSVLSVAARFIQVDGLPATLTQRTIAWLGENISPTLSSDTKYHVVNAANRRYRDSANEESRREATRWICAIQPVSKDDRGTWNRIGNLLGNACKTGINELSTVFSQLCVTSAETVLDLMAERDFRYFLHDLKAEDAGLLVAPLALSTDTPTRKLGLLLFNELDIEEFPADAINASDPTTVQILFYESQRTFLSPKAIARLLAAVASVAEKTSEEFQGELLDELILQCQNFAGGCREELERLASENPLIDHALKSVAEHFEALKHAKDAGINAMEVAGVRKAAREQRRRFSRQVSEGARSASPLLSLMKHVSLLYGRSSSQFIDGVLQDARPLGHTSHTMEIPMVDYFDPEEMALRRMHASASIAALLDSIQPEGGDDER